MHERERRKKERAKEKVTGTVQWVIKRKRATKSRQDTCTVATWTPAMPTAGVDLCGAISRLDSLVYLNTNLRMNLLSQLFFFYFYGTWDTFQDVWFQNTLVCCHPLHELCNRLSCVCTQLNMGFLIHWGIWRMAMSLSEEHCLLRKNEDEDYTCQTIRWLRGWLAVGLKKTNVTAMK